jgi:hypothetical protein
MHGGKGLKQTQAYPVGFGEAVADAYCQHRRLFGPPSVWCDLTADDDWPDARLDLVIRELSH